MKKHLVLFMVLAGCLMLQGQDRPFGPTRLALPGATTLPTTCAANIEVYIDTDATPAGQQVFLCNSAGNGFNLIGDGIGQVEVQMVLFDFTTAVATGDGAFYFHIATGSKLIGMDLIDAIAAVITVSSSGLPTVDIARCAPVATGNPCSGTVADVLTVNLTIDANEDSSDTATTAITIATASDDVIVDQTWRIDVDVAGTGTQGLIVTLIFQTP